MLLMSETEYVFVVGVCSGTVIPSCESVMQTVVRNVDVALMVPQEIHNEDTLCRQGINNHKGVDTDAVPIFRASFT